MSAAPRISPQRAAETLERLGPTFVKAGQYLAMRPDVLPPEYCEEFLRLVDAATPEPLSSVQQTIREDLGDVADAFEWFDPTPVGAASLAQVHRARTREGDVVAVKVQRRGVAESVDRDLRRLRLLAPVIEQAGVAPGVSVPELVAELKGWMHEELDLRRELRNLERMYQLGAGVDLATIPRPWRELSADRVLTAEYLSGVPFSELLRTPREQRDARLARLGLDAEALAEHLLETVLGQIFRLELFHADIHPGNLLALPGDRIGFVDFGLVDSLDPTVRERLFRYLRAVYAGDAEKMLQGLSELLLESEAADPAGLRESFYEETRAWRRARALRGADGAPEESPVAGYMIGVLRAARQHGYRVPPSLLSMYRSLLTAETIAHALGSSADLTTVGREFFGRLEVQRVVESLAPDKVLDAALQGLDVSRSLPGAVQQVLSELAEDRLVLRVESIESPADQRRQHRRARLVTLAVLSVSLSVVLLAVRDSEVAGVPVDVVVGLLLAAVYAAILVLWRRLR